MYSFHLANVNSRKTPFFPKKASFCESIKIMMCDSNEHEYFAFFLAHSEWVEILHSSSAKQWPSNFVNYWCDSGHDTSVTPSLPIRHSPCRLFLFLKLVRVMKGCWFCTADEGTAALTRALNKIPVEELHRCAYMNWKRSSVQHYCRLPGFGFFSRNALQAWNKVMIVLSTFVRNTFIVLP